MIAAILTSMRCMSNSWSLLKLMSIKLMMPSSHLILCHPLLLLPPVFPSIKVFSSESVLHIRWPEYWSFSFSISPSHEYSGLISFTIDWLDLLAVQGTLKSLLQHHSLKASIFQCSAPLETNWDQSIVFEVAPKYCILNFFIDSEGYSISSKGFLPTVVGTTVIWI